MGVSCAYAGTYVCVCICLRVSQGVPVVGVHDALEQFHQVQQQLHVDEQRKPGAMLSVTVVTFVQPVIPRVGVAAVAGGGGGRVVTLRGP